MTTINDSAFALSPTARERKTIAYGGGAGQGRAALIRTRPCTRVAAVDARFPLLRPRRMSSIEPATGGTTGGTTGSGPICRDGIPGVLYPQPPNYAYVHIVACYVESSHQNGHTVLEILLALFAIRTLLQSRTRADNGEKHFIHFSEKEVDELVDEWTPEPLGAPLTPEDQSDLASAPFNLASYNFTGLAGNETIKVRAIDPPKYGVGSCGPPGFYGTIDVHMDLERDIADFLSTEASILYSQGFLTIPSVIPAFAKRGDIIVADRGISFAVQKGLQISRSTRPEEPRRCAPERRKNVANVADLSQDDSLSPRASLRRTVPWLMYQNCRPNRTRSYGTLSRPSMPLICHMIIGSVANGLNSSGGFCAGILRGLATSFVFSAAVPALLAVSASEGINILRNTPSILSTIQENVRTIRAVLDPVEAITIPSHVVSPIIHIYLRSAATLSASTSASAKPLNPATPEPRDAPSSREIVDEALAQGVWTTRARLRGKELVEARPSIRLAVTAALSRKECERAAGVIKAAVVKVLTKRK
ncbi:serine palmitoyltransferase [Lactarius pseudohatsudake]|nr:serine palmitoyltransferase [Lactarius pseudohatsudake]